MLSVIIRIQVKEVALMHPASLNHLSLTFFFLSGAKDFSSLPLADKFFASSDDCTKKEASKHADKNGRKSAEEGSLLTSVSFPPTEEN